jgi:hypothetical protein
MKWRKSLSSFNSIRPYTEPIQILFKLSSSNTIPIQLNTVQALSSLISTRTLLELVLI